MKEFVKEYIESRGGLKFLSKVEKSTLSEVLNVASVKAPYYVMLKYIRGAPTPSPFSVDGGGQVDRTSLRVDNVKSFDDAIRKAVASVKKQNAKQNVEVVAVAAQKNKTFSSTQANGFFG